MSLIDYLYINVLIASWSNISIQIIEYALLGNK